MRKKCFAPFNLITKRHFVQRGQEWFDEVKFLINIKIVEQQLIPRKQLDLPRSHENKKTGFKNLLEVEKLQHDALS